MAIFGAQRLHKVVQRLQRFGTFSYCFARHLLLMPWFHVQLLHATRCNSNCRLSNVKENIHEAKMLQPMTTFGGIT